MPFPITYLTSDNYTSYPTVITSSDVTTALGYTPYNATNPSGFITSSALSPYLTSETAASTYYPLTNPSGYISSADLAGLVPYTGATANVNLGTNNLRVGSGTVSSNSIQIGAENVGLFSPSTNRIDFVTNGISRMAILSSGNVVMGSTTTNVVGNIFVDYVTNQTGLKLSSTVLNLAVSGENLLNIYGVTTSSNTTSFSLTKPNNTGQTATFSISGWNYNGGTRQWLTGNIGTQSENVWGGVTYSFVGASNIDVAYGNVFNQATAGTNATISTNYAAHFIGNIFMSGGNRVIRGSNGLTLEGAGGGPTTVRAGSSGTVCLGILGETNGLVYSGYFSTGAVTNFNFNKASSIGQTASTAIAGWSYTGNSRTWLTGNITAQNENIWGAVTYNFGGASVIAKAIGNVFNAPIAGTNCTITANFAAQFNGNVEMVGAMTSLYYVTVTNPNAVATAAAKVQVVNAAGNTAQFSIASNSDSTDASLLSIGGSNRGIILTSNSVGVLKIFDSTRNVTIQNGGTFVDNGYRLDVQGTANVLTSLNVGNYATPSGQRAFVIGQDTAYMSIGSLVGATSNVAMYFNTTTPSVSNYGFRSDGANLWVNSPSASASILFTTGSTATPLRMYGNQNTASVASYVLVKPTYLNGTASTSIAGWSYDGTTRQWLTGNITTQNENVWGAVTYSFVGASTIATAFGNVFNAPIAGTNCTITANYAARFNGAIYSDSTNSSIFDNSAGSNYLRVRRTGGTIEAILAATGGGVFVGSSTVHSTNIQTSGVTRISLFSTGNTVIQNGGTFTDAGYLFDVQGTTRITGDTTIGSTGQLFQFSTSASNPAYTQTGATGSSIYTVSGGLQVKMQSFSGGQNWLFATGGRFLTGTSDAQPYEFYTTNLKRVQISANGSMVFYVGTTYDEGANIAIGTTTGTKIGTSTTQKIGFWFATPIVQPANTTSLNGVLENTGLMASGSTVSTINKPLVVGTNTTPRTGTATDGVTSVLGDLKTWGANYFTGEVLYNEVSGEALSFGQLCYRDRFGKWSKALANVASETSYNMLGVCLHTVGAADTAISILTKGYFETTYIVGGNTGDPLYIDATTAGSITNATPTAAGNVVRLVGNVFWDATSQTNGKWILNFAPDNTWIEL